VRPPRTKRRAAGISLRVGETGAAARGRSDGHGSSPTGRPTWRWRSTKEVGDLLGHPVSGATSLTDGHDHAALAPAELDHPCPIGRPASGAGRPHDDLDGDGQLLGSLPGPVRTDPTRSRAVAGRTAGASVVQQLSTPGHSAARHHPHSATQRNTSIVTTRSLGGHDHLAAGRCWQPTEPPSTSPSGLRTDLERVEPDPTLITSLRSSTGHASTVAPATGVLLRVTLPLPCSDR